ncbi:MAG TPA: hypothetical protein VFI16_04750 [Anaeromyxobacteraceae bacterium]|nr:hypothetical protein [Anaeromyxobacteraceae bacterium]
MRRPLLAAAAIWALAACGSNEHCTGDAQCSAPEQACRPEVRRCSGFDDVVTLGEGRCRDRGASCSKAEDCVPLETCQVGTCKPDPSLCTGPVPTCPAGCAWIEPFPCACVCQACPPPP